MVVRPHVLPATHRLPLSQTHTSTCFGPTCDSMYDARLLAFTHSAAAAATTLTPSLSCHRDVVCRNIVIPELEIGDWLYFHNSTYEGCVLTHSLAHSLRLGTRSGSLHASFGLDLQRHPVACGALLHFLRRRRVDGFSCNVSARLRHLDSQYTRERERYLHNPISCCSLAPSHTHHARIGHHCLLLLTLSLTHTYKERRWWYQGSASRLGRSLALSLVCAFIWPRLRARNKSSRSRSTMAS